jgi:hypothetical protein
MQPVRQAYDQAPEGSNQSMKSGSGQTQSFGDIGSMSGLPQNMAARFMSTRPKFIKNVLKNKSRR